MFVCRSTGRIPAKWIVNSPDGVADLVRADLEELRVSNFTATLGDIRCIILGHLTRLAVWYLRKDWNRGLPTVQRLRLVADWLYTFGSLATVEQHLEDILSKSPSVRHMAAQEGQTTCGDTHAQIPF